MGRSPQGRSVSQLTTKRDQIESDCRIVSLWNFFPVKIPGQNPDGTMGPVARAISRVGSTTSKPIPIAIVAAALCVANLVVWYPGISTADSDSQYAQAIAQQFNDWHPPIMAWLWSMFRLFAEGNGPIFSFHIACYWLGFGLIATALSRAARPLAAWGMIGVGLFPPFLMMNAIILKDVGLAVTFLAAFAALFWYRVQGRKIPFAVVAISFVVLLYGTLVRTNAVFGVVPLLAYMINPEWLGRPWRLLALSIPTALLIVPISSVFNHSVLGAAPLGIIRSLEIFDLTGIAFYSGDVSVFGPGNSFTRQDVESCYTPVEWDALSPWGKCQFFWNRLAISRDLQQNTQRDLQPTERLDPTAAMEARPNPDLLNRWVASIVRHPLAYARHRLTHFCSEIYFFDDPIDADQAVPVGVAGNQGVASPAPTGQQKPLYLMLYNVLTLPAFWLAIGACLMVLLASVRPPRRSARIEAALVLVMSALLYTCAYLIIGVGTDSRYQYWSMLAIFTALVISLSALKVPFVSLPTRGWPNWTYPLGRMGSE